MPESFRPSRRELVLNAADALGAPAPPRLNAALVAIQAGVELSPRQYFSIRLEDEKTYGRRFEAHARYVVPAIRWDRPFDRNTPEPAKGFVAASDWPLDLRIRTPHAPDLWNLRHTLAAITLFETLYENDADLQHIAMAERLIEQLARKVQGALVPGKALDAERIRRAVRVEHDKLEGLDARFRDEAAEGLARLPEPLQLWGRELRDLKKGGGGKRGSLPS